MSRSWSLESQALDHRWPVLDHRAQPIRWCAAVPGLGGALAWLQAQDLGPQPRLGICAPPSPALAALIQAAPLAGVALALLPHRLAAEDREHLREEAGCARVAGIDLPLPEHFSALPLAAIDPLEAEDLALILGTSGTSDRPKAVGLSLRAVLTAAAASATHLGLGPQDRWLACLPLDHAGGAMLCHRAAVSGCSLLLTAGFELASVEERLPQASGVSLVPTMLHRLIAARAGRPWPDALRCILTGGAALPPDLRAACAALGRAPCHSYGLSESGGMVCAQAPAGETRDDSGCALPGYALRCDADGIGFRSPAAFSGYLSRGTIDRPRNPQDWFATGDQGRLSDGRLEVAGRRDDLIVSGGENVAPTAVEAVLRRHPGIDQAAVVGLPDPEWGQRVAALLVAGPGFDAATFPAWLATHLAPQQRPRSWLAVATLPVTQRGKLDRQRARELLLAGTRH